MKFKSAFSVACMALATSVAADAAESFDEALKGGKVKGKFGIYHETVDEKNDPEADGFTSAFFKLKYETAKWGNLQFGAEAFAAAKLHDENGDFAKDFEGDDNSPAALSQFYAKYHFTDKSHAVVGRFDHSKISHIDDAQSEGGYIQYKEIDGLTVNAGFMTQYAELDYDDYEDFGREGGDQDLGDEPLTDDYVLFVDTSYVINDNATVKPYLYHQGDYATVMGADLVLSSKLNDDTKIGANLMAYNVDGNADNSDGDSDVISLQPWVKVGNFKFGLGYAQFGQGQSKPFWFNDYVTGFDQKKSYGETENNDLTATQATIEYKNGNYKVRLGVQKWEEDNSAKFDQREYELLVGYKFSKAMDLSLRFFDVENEYAGTEDYQKFETRLRYKF